MNESPELMRLYDAVSAHILRSELERSRRALAAFEALEKADFPMVVELKVRDGD